MDRAPSGSWPPEGDLEQSSSVLPVIALTRELVSIDGGPIPNHRSDWP
jgi:hypothetical protein